MTGPLQGIRVLDLSRILSGPFCTMLLADLGAEVVKVERPGAGDPARILGPRVGEDSSYFISVNRGKKSITIELSKKEGQELIRALTPNFDVLVENFMPGTMAKFGLDFANLSQINPRLVYASITGFGQDGPGADRPALDIIVQAMGGIMSVTGESVDRPIRPGASLGDSTAGTFAALSIVSALWHRNSTGKGQHVDMSMLDCQVTVMENAFSRYFATGQIPAPMGTRHPAAAPFQAFRASDGSFVLGLITDDVETWKRFCTAIGMAGLGQDNRFATNSGRNNRIDLLAGILQDVFSRQTVSHWLDTLTSAGIPCGPINDIRAVCEDPQVKHRNMLPAIPHSSAGEWRVANTPFRFSEAGTGPAGPSPRLGEHTAQVLGQALGLSESQLESLHSDGVI